MRKFIPLTATPCENAVLLIDAAASYLDLEACADQRLQAAKGLLYSLAHMGFTDVEPKDLHNLTDAAYLLLEDASELFQVARSAAVRGGAVHK
ncbi:MAG TPA: hypothetical protein VGC62_05330 [Pseudomonas sp.]|uniref:hypothetical protein n=1 Tax=Pseudomonas sp. TaxID=306 RepID=UPI002EDA24F1